jgi:hypothetical protein
MKTTKRILIVATVAGACIVLIYSLLFTTAEIPASFVNPTPASSREKYTALVLKRFPRETLKPGDLILVEMNDGTTSTREIRKIESIQLPSESKRMKAAGRRRTRRIGQAILDMDFKPHYSVSAGENTNSTPVSIPESDVIGKVAHTFTKKRT